MPIVDASRLKNRPSRREDAPGACQHRLELCIVAREVQHRAHDGHVGRGRVERGGFDRLVPEADPAAARARAERRALARPRPTTDRHRRRRRRIRLPEEEHQVASAAAAPVEDAHARSQSARAGAGRTDRCRCRRKATADRCGIDGALTAFRRLRPESGRSRRTPGEWPSPPAYSHRSSTTPSARSALSNSRMTTRCGSGTVPSQPLRLPAPRQIAPAVCRQRRPARPLSVHRRNGQGRQSRR